MTVIEHFNRTDPDQEYWKLRLAEYKHELEDNQGQLISDPGKIALTLEKIMILKCMDAESVYQIANAIEVFNRKKESQKQLEKVAMFPNVSAWFFGQIFATIIYTIILFAGCAIATFPLSLICGKSNSTVCLTNASVRYFFYGTGRE